MSNQLTNELIALIFNKGQILREKARVKTHLQECSFLHMQTLIFIKDQGQAAMKDLAGYLHITPPSATSLINSLVNRGFVERTPDERDRRTIKLQVSPAGLSLLKNSFKGLTTIVEEKINKLNEQEKKAFINILNKIS